MALYLLRMSKLRKDALHAVAKRVSKVVLPLMVSHWL